LPLSSEARADQGCRKRRNQVPDWSEITCRFPPKSPAAFDRNQVPVCSDFCTHNRPPWNLLGIALYAQRLNSHPAGQGRGREAFGLHGARGRLGTPTSFRTDFELPPTEPRASQRPSAPERRLPSAPFSEAWSCVSASCPAKQPIGAGDPVNRAIKGLRAAAAVMLSQVEQVERLSIARSPHPFAKRQTSRSDRDWFSARQSWVDPQPMVSNR
jgi:hypothetical protein